MHEKKITQYKQSEHLNTSDILQLVFTYGDSHEGNIAANMGTTKI